MVVYLINHRSNADYVLVGYALSGRDEALARRVIEDDSIVDQLEIKVDDVAVHLLSKAPLASDLRLITIAMKAPRPMFQGPIFGHFEPP